VRKLKLVFLLALLAILVSSCMAKPQEDDAARAAKYKSAAASLPHVASVDSNYKTNPGMGRTANVYIQADTSDKQELMTLLKQAFPAIINAAKDDPEVGLDILITPADKTTGLSPEDLGYSGAGTLTSYRDFLKAHPDLSSAR